MVRIGFLLLLSIIFSQTVLASFNWNRKDQIGDGKAMTKLKELRQLSIDSKNDEKEAAIYNLLYEARVQHNLLYEAIAYQHLSTYKNSFTEKDSLSFYLIRALDTFNAITDPSSDEELYNRVGVLITESVLMDFLLRNKKEQALYLIKENLAKSKTRNTPVLEQSAYSNMGTILSTMKKYKESVEAFEKSLVLMNKLPDNAKRGRLTNLYTNIAIAYQNLKSYDQTLIYCDSIAIFAEEEIKAGDIIDYYTFINNILYANAYFGKKDLRMTRKYLDICKYLSSVNQDEGYVAQYYEIEANYYLYTKNYLKALEYIHKIFDIYDPLENKNYLFIESSLLLYAEILEKMKRSEEAYNVLYKLYITNDSINRTDYATQLAELETIFQVEKLKDEAKINDIKFHKLKIQFIFSILLSISILVILILIWYYYKRKKANRLLLSQKEKEIEMKEIELQEIKELVIEIKESQDFHQEIINKLDSYMSDSKAYNQPNVTRQEIAVQVGTNRQYLIDAIKSIKGQTFNEYLYTLRIEYAYTLLTSNADMPIAEVQAESGFLSQPVFNTAFKVAYGITPSELRRKIMNGEEI